MKSGDAQSDLTGRPTGTVTFLFTDIEGSTRLWQDHPHEMKTAVADHDRIVRTIVGDHGGYVFATGGDGFSVAFTHPLEAAIAALEVQAAFAGHDWGSVGSVRVRMALDTGLADERDGDYFGPALNRVARILDQTSGGEILTSNTTADILTHQLPIGYGLERVGRRHLRDVEGVTTLHRLRRTTEQRPASAVRRPAAATAAAILVVAAGWLALGGLSDSSNNGGGLDQGGVDPPTAVSQTPPSIESTVTWTVDLGPLTTPPIIVGDYVIVSLDTDDNRVVALHRDTGREAWSTEMDSRVTQLATDDAYVYVTTRIRLEVLHPSTGGILPTCGFELPGALAETAVGEGALYIRDYGAMYLVETHPGSQPCHSGLIENASYLSGLTATLPFVESGIVAVGDQRGAYVFDAATLVGVWKYPEHQQTLSAVSVAVRERTVEYAMRVESGAELMVTTSDGAMYLFDLSQPPGDAQPRMARIDQSFEPVFTDNVIAAVTRSGGVVGYGSNLDPLWPAFLPQEPITALGAGPTGTGTLIVASGHLVTVVDAIDGVPLEEVDVPHAVTSVGASTEVLVLADHDAGRVSAVLSATATGASDWSAPPTQELADDVATVVADFVEAVDSADLRAVQALTAYDAFVWRSKFDGLWEREHRERVWARFEYGFVMGESWALSDCLVEPADQSSMTCTRVATDLVSEAASLEPDVSTTTFVVENGVIRRISDAFEVWTGTHHDDLRAWVGEMYTEKYSEACIGPRPQSESAECATLLVEHLDDWLSTMQP